VLFSEDYGGHQSGFGPLDLRVVVRMGDVEHPYQSYQEGLHLDDAIQNPVFNVLGRVDNMRDVQRTQLATQGSP